MRHHLRGLLGRTLVPVLGGGALGGTAAALYAVLCAAVYWIITSNLDPLVPLVTRFATAGAVAGIIVGVCLACDWATRGADPLASWDDLQEKELDGGLSGKSKLPPTATGQSVRALAPPTPGPVPGSLPGNQQPLARLATKRGTSGGAPSWN